MSSRVIFGLFIFVSVCIQAVASFHALPNKLHCLARVSFKNENHNPADHLRVDEYVDIDARRSSINIHDFERGTTEIHYNKLYSNYLGGRKSIVYKPEEWTCDTLQISDWQLADLRRVAIHMHKLIDLNGEKYIDVPIGPSVLAYATHSNVKRFKFTKTVISKTLVSNVNVYRLKIDYHPLNSIFRRIQIEVHVSTLDQRRGLKPDDTLASALLDNSHLDIKYFGVCQLEKREGLFAPKTSKADGESANDTNEDEFCAPDSGNKLLFEIHFDIIEEYKPGSLVRKQNNELAPKRYDFSEDPLMQPVGMGCWNSDGNLGWQSKLIDDQSRSSISASYVTSFESNWLSYVAYDGVAHLLRLDRQGRRSIYDLRGGKSYHSGELSSSSEHQANLAESELGAERCIVFDMNDKTSVIKTGSNILEQLLGLSPNKAHYLGTKFIEHEQYEVYEQMITSIEEVPVLLRSKMDRYNQEDYGNIYVTYYIQDDNLSRLIEVYHFKAANRFPILINKLRFVEFSWSLEVEPTDDPLSQISDSNLRLFEMESCLLNRANQAQLVVGFKVDKKEQLGQIDSDQFVRAIKQNKLKLTTNIHQMFAESLKISQLNIVGLRLNITPKTGDLLATSRIVDLHLGLNQLKLLGNIIHSDKVVEGYKIHEFKSRHSFEECYLDSIQVSERNLGAYCPHWTSCVILKRDDELISKIEKWDIKQVDDLVGTNSKKDLCYVFEIKYSSIDKTMRSMSALDQIDTNLPTLDQKSFEFLVESYNDENSGNLQPGFAFPAQAQVRSYMPLFAIGVHSSTTLTVLSGLRYSTMKEEPAAKNFNMRVPIPKNLTVTEAQSRASIFNHCQLSCQIDEFCGSFSFCSGSRGVVYDCVLSTLRLTHERVAKFVIETDHVKGNERKFQVDFMALSGNEEFKSQQFVMYKDEECSLHPRNFMSDHKLMRSVTYQDKYQSDDIDHKNVLESLFQDDRQMSLEDCAGLSFEKTFGCLSMRNTNFTYCPLDSLCFVNGDEAIDSSDHVAGPCLSYQRQATRAYKSAGYHRLGIIPLLPKNEHDAKQITSNDSKLLELPTDDLTNPIKTFFALTEEDCARDCSFHKLDCLAFDSCRNNGAIICRLYHVRSPLSKRGAYLPLLKHEQEIIDNHKVELVMRRNCEHFYLKPAYFEVRLKNLLARQEVETSEHSPELENLEEKIETSYEKIDKQELQLLIEQSTQRTQSNTKQTSHRWIYWVELLIGLTLGCVSILLKQQITDGVSLAYSRVRRSQNDSSTHSLVIDDNL